LRFSHRITCPIPRLITGVSLNCSLLPGCSRPAFKPPDDDFVHRDAIFFDFSSFPPPSVLDQNYRARRTLPVGHCHCGMYLFSQVHHFQALVGFNLAPRVFLPSEPDRNPSFCLGLLSSFPPPPPNQIPAGPGMFFTRATI